MWMQRAFTSVRKLSNFGVIKINYSRRLNCRVKTFWPESAQCLLPVALGGNKMSASERDGVVRTTAPHVYPPQHGAHDRICRDTCHHNWKICLCDTSTVGRQETRKKIFGALLQRGLKLSKEWGWLQGLGIGRQSAGSILDREVWTLMACGCANIRDTIVDGSWRILEEIWVYSRGLASGYPDRWRRASCHFMMTR